MANQQSLTAVEAANKAKGNVYQDALTGLGLSEDMMIAAGVDPDILRAKLEGALLGAGGLAGLIGAGAVANTAMDFPVTAVPQGDLAIPIYQSDTSMVWGYLRKLIDRMKANTAARTLAYDYGKMLGKQVASGTNIEHRATYVSWLYAPSIPGNDEAAAATINMLLAYFWWTPEMVADAKRIAGIPI